jgi:hypothetical protein
MVLGNNVKDYTTDEDLYTCLEAYRDALAGLLNK